jgi:hypothetical protein
VQLVEASHDGKVGLRGRPRQITDAAAANPQFPRLPCHWQRVHAIDHRFALGNSPAQLRNWAERPGQKIVHQRQLADLGVQGLHVDRRRRRFAVAVRAEDPGGSLHQLSAPSRDLVRVNVKQLR